MNEIKFKRWLSINSVSKKTISDIVSRIKRIEKSINNIDLDQEYKKDKCHYLLTLFCNEGKNKKMDKERQNNKQFDLPIGKYQTNSFKYSINKYIKYLNDLYTY